MLNPYGGQLTIVQALDQVIKIQVSEIVRDYNMDLTHLGILFVMDRNKTGRFYKEDILSFVEMVYEREEQARSNHEQVGGNKLSRRTIIVLWSALQLIHRTIFKPTAP